MQMTLLGECIGLRKMPVRIVSVLITHITKRREGAIRLTMKIDGNGHLATVVTPSLFLESRWRKHLRWQSKHGEFISNEGRNRHARNILPQSEYPVPCVCYEECLKTHNLLHAIIHHQLLQF